MAKKFAEGNHDILQNIRSSAIEIKALVKMENEAKNKIIVKSENFSDEEDYKNYIDEEIVPKLDYDSCEEENEPEIMKHKHSCDICNYSSKESGHLRRHKRLKHPEQSEEWYLSTNTKLCTICDPKENNPNTMKHYKLCHNVSSLDVHSCPICWEWFPTDEDLEHHTQFHTDDPKKLHCNICSHVCAAKFNIRPRNSLRAQDGCQIPVGQPSMNEHLKEHETVHKCDDCEIVFPSKRGLKGHMINKHKQGRELSCEHCGKVYMKQQQLDNHIEMHHSNVKYECEECGNNYPTKVYLRMHKKRIHQKETIVCHVCAKPVIKQTFKLHLLTHNGEKSFVCDFPGCNKRFAAPNTLRAHVLIHSADKPYKCDLCDACFKKPDHRNRHRLCHTGERPHVCQYCGKGFIQNFNMKIHQDKCKL